jgi:argininosuccinate lyase
MMAKTEASGGPQLLPAVLRFTSSLALDVELLREDIVGSLAHVHMLGQTGILKRDDVKSLRRALTQLWVDADAGRWVPQGEEDIHMAIEAELHRRIGSTAGLLHTARSRNDQVALDLRLYARSQCAAVLGQLATLLDRLHGLAEQHRNTLMPSYTHRQRAQPISLAYWLCGYGTMFARDVELFEAVLKACNKMPLGVGAIAGTSLPIDREQTRQLLQFSSLTENGLDTVGDRDFALDFSYAAARAALHISRLATDVIDFSSVEFGFIQLGDAISFGSSMMPQKRNPDLFELLRGKSAHAIGSLMNLMVMVKGLPGGYNRDLQEDRRVVLEGGPALVSALSMLEIGLGNLRFDVEKCLSAVSDGSTQATDLAEALVGKGLPFREAYQAVGTLVARATSEGVELAAVTLSQAQAVHPLFTSDVLQRTLAQQAVARKVNAGGTGPQSVATQMATLKSMAHHAKAIEKTVPTLDALFSSLSES